MTGRVAQLNSPFAEEREEDIDGKKSPDDEWDVLLTPEGTVIFSWNTPDIQRFAKCVGDPEFEPPRWCG